MTGRASDEVLVERFQREEEIGKSLNHPGILKVFADEDRSQIYIVTKCFDGQTLRQQNALSGGEIQAGRKLSQERALHIALNVCSATGTSLKSRSRRK